jgi:anti-sigma regulatory factor (Ser/Thr protein kinase)
VTEMTGDTSVIALDRLWSDNAAEPGANLLDVVFGWTDFTQLRRLVSRHCAAAGLTGTRLDDFVLAIHEISANAIVHAGTAARLILQRVTHGLRCLVADIIPCNAVSCTAPGRADALELGGADALKPDEPAGSDSGRGLWLAATLADELSITCGPDRTIVSLYMRLD